MIRPLVCLAVLAPFLSAQEPIKQATEARIWLQVPLGDPPLRDIQVSSGSATQAGWEKDAAVRERHTDILVPIRWWDWKTFTIRFTPAADGQVTLGLLGPWEADPSGTVLRKEVLWDNISATGTEITNGGFESQTADGPEAWKILFGAPLKPVAWPLDGEPLEGKFLAAAWQNRPLGQSLTVKKDRPVTITLHAHAATPPDFIAPKRLGQDTPAHRALAKIKRGVNLGNGWEAPPPYSWGVRFTPEDIDHIADGGFDHIRVPVAWHYHLKNGNEIDPAFFAELDPILQRAIDRKLHILLDWHHFDDLTTDPAANLARFVAVWEHIATHYKEWPPALFLELLNEPRDKLTTVAANPIYAQTIAAIRKIDPQRIIIVSPGNWGSPSELDQLRLLDNDDRIAVTVHCYAPFHFTHQGANWVNLTALTGVIYPGPPTTSLAVPASLQGDTGVIQFIENYNKLPADRNPSSIRPVREALDLARDWSVHFGRPIDLGEFGSRHVADLESRIRYTRDVRKLAEERHIPWSLWEWKAGFGYWNPATNKPILRPAIFEP